MKPKYTDGNRYPRGYRNADNTDITRTWEAARKRLAEEAEKRSQIVKQLPQRKKA